MTMPLVITVACSHPNEIQTVNQTNGGMDTSNFWTDFHDSNS